MNWLRKRYSTVLVAFGLEASELAEIGWPHALLLCFYIWHQTRTDGKLIERGVKTR